MTNNIVILKKQVRTQGVKYFIQSYDDNGKATTLEISKSQFIAYQANHHDLKEYNEKSYYFRYEVPQ